VIKRETHSRSNLTQRPHRRRTHIDGSVVFVGLRQCAPHLTHASLVQPKSKTQMASRSVQPFLHISRQKVPILYNGPTPSPHCPFASGIWTQCNTWFPGPTRFLNPNGISIGSAAFAGLKLVTDRPTDRPRYFVCNNRPHLRTLHCMYCMSSSSLDIYIMYRTVA